MLQTIPGYVITTKNSGDYMAQVRGIAANDNKKITLTINGHRIGNLQERIEGDAFPEVTDCSRPFTFR